MALGGVLAAAAGMAWAQDMGWPRGGQCASEAIEASPLLVDLDGDGRLEIVVPNLDDRLYVYDHAGRARTGWPAPLGFGDGSIASAAAGDVDGDGAPELVVAGDDLLAQNATVRVFETNGTLRASIGLNAAASAKATPCLVDYYRYTGPSEGNRHAALEIVLRDGDGLLHVLYWNGAGLTDRGDGTTTYQTVTDLSLKDRYGAQPITSSAAAWGDGAGQTTIVVGSTDGKVYRWSVVSTPATNWSITKETPFSVSGAVKFLGSPALTDLNGDALREVIAGGNNGRVYA